MPGQGCKIGIPLLHNDSPQRANTWINPEKSREMRTDLRAAHEIGPRKRRGGKKWECQRNPACSRGRIRNEWGETLLDGARGGCVRRRNRGRSGKSADKPGSVERADPETGPPGNHSSGRRVTTPLKQPTRGLREQRRRPPIWPCPGWGLPCRHCHQCRGGLLPHRFTLA